MRSLYLAWRSLFNRSRHNGIKILSLGVGLALGLMLIAKMRFEQSYDNFYPDCERIYNIYNVGTAPDGKVDMYLVSGGVAVGLKADIPEIEAATRITVLREDAVFFTENKNKLVGNFYLADSCLFDVVPRPMILGNAKEVLAQPGYVLVSRSMAERIAPGDKVIGQQITLDAYPNQSLTIGGVFEDLPENSFIHYDALVSLPSISRFMWDGSLYWGGNSRYIAYVKLAVGVDPASLIPAIKQIEEKYTDVEAMHQAGYYMSHILRPITVLYADQPGVQRMVTILALLAVVLLLTASMNYILIVVSSMVGRSKEVGVLKCYGASGKDISKTILSEAFVHIVLALLVAVVLVLAFQETIEKLTRASMEALFPGSTCLLLGGVVGLVFLLTGLTPAYLYAKISVTSAFQRDRDSKRMWKRGLLFFQFAITAFLIILLIIIGRQYRLMIDDNPGYDYRNVLYCQTDGVSSEVRQRVLTELRRFAFVESTSSAFSLPFLETRGNNVRIDPSQPDLFNVADLSQIDTNYLTLMRIPLIEGRNFQDRQSDTTQMLVSRSFADKCVQLLHWQDGVIGKTVFVTQHGMANICGVFENIRTGSLVEGDNRPAIFLFAKMPAQNLLIRVHNLKPEYIVHISELLTRMIPNKDIQVIPLSAEIVGQYAESKLFRDTVMVGSLLALVIALFGLIGYTQDEISRRRKEISIRRINGASVQSVIILFARDVILIALPAVVVGGVGAYFVGLHWLRNFSKQVSMSWPTFLIGTLVVLLIVVGCVVLKSWRIAYTNPVQNLKSE